MGLPASGTAAAAHPALLHVFLVRACAFGCQQPAELHTARLNPSLRKPTQLPTHGRGQWAVGLWGCNHGAAVSFPGAQTYLVMHVHGDICKLRALPSTVVFGVYRHA